MRVTLGLSIPGRLEKEELPAELLLDCYDGTAVPVDEALWRGQLVRPGLALLPRGNGAHSTAS